MKWIIVILMQILLSVVSLRYLALAQSNNYKVKININIIKYYIMTIGLVLPCILCEIFFSPNDIFDAIKIILLCCIIVIMYIYAKNLQTQLKFTKRARRNYFISNCFSFIILLIISLLLNGKTVFIAIYSNILILPSFVIITLKITEKYFEKKNKEFVETEVKKLDSMHLIKIGITGSFGKTSCKNILLNMLKTKYNVIATQGNYNTPMGIAFTVQRMTGKENVFIAEMGARRKGEIKYLCDLVKPDIGIITGVCQQHLETFGSLHAIYMEKNMLSQESKVCFYNGNDKYALKMYKERKTKKYKSGVEKVGDVFIDNISQENNFTNFDLHIKDEVYHSKTYLLGKHNLQNIALCTAVAYYLEVPTNDIVNSIENMKSVEHRMEYTFNNGIHIIDDGYNSNEQGIKYAMGVLQNFDGRKVIVSQGLVECGKESKKLNKEVGKIIAQNADVLILCGCNRRNLKVGVKESDFKGVIFTYKNLKKAKKDFNQILQKGDVLLLQNDVPDIY